MIYYIYKITRDDGQIYIGTTNDGVGLKNRISCHRCSDRFKGHNFVVDIIESDVDYDYIQKMEEYYIKKFDSFYNGLNESIDGKGNHMALNFTTKGYKFSKNTRKKMSLSKKNSNFMPWNAGKKMSEEFKKKISESKKGTVAYTKLEKSDVIKIREDYNNKINKYNNVGKVMKNGKRMSYIQAFSIDYSKRYNVTSTNIRRILNKETWLNV